MLKIQLLGRFAVTSDGRRIDLRLRAAQSLLAFLALSAGKAFRREQLAGLLWPDVDEATARGHLRHTLWRLRKALGASDCLVANDLTLTFDPDADFWLDARVIAGKPDGAASPETLMQAAALYEGELLPGFYEEWVVLERDRLQAAYEAWMLLLLDRLAANQRWDDVVEWSERWIAKGRAPEAAYRALIQAHGCRGDASNAALAYRRCVIALRDGLGVDPSPQTRAVYERWLQGDLAARVPEPRVRVLRGYQLEERIGAGAFGEVYRAFQTGVGRRVAIKVIAPQHANRPEFVRQFEAEARLVAQLEHPHIVPLFDFWREPDGAYLVMRWLPRSLRAVLTEGRLELAAALRLVEQIASALMAAHRRGIAHLDLKPDNILLDDEGNAYLADFGIARAVGPVSSDHQTTSSCAYSAPEQVQGLSASTRSDLYSLGLVIYEMLTGRHPFVGATPAEMIDRQVRERLPDLSAQAPGVPRELDRVIQRATAKDPAARYADIATLLADLRQVAVGESPVAAVAFDPVNPYKGLRAFDEADAPDFFGRNDLVKLLLGRLADHDSLARLLTIAGPSGCGKSSVVRAGLIPALRAGALSGSEHWFMALLTPGEHPLKSLEAALSTIATRSTTQCAEQLRAHPSGLTWAVNAALGDADGDALLIIDQFEELFTLTLDETERAHFLDLLVSAVITPESRVRVVLALRSDFIDRLLQYPAFGDLMRRRTEYVLPLSAEELGRAVTGPASRVGVLVEPELLAGIAVDLSEEPGALPLLQVALSETFQRRTEQRMTLAAYHEAGGVFGALARQAEEVFTSLDQAGQSATRHMFLRLVMLGDGFENTRRRALQSELEMLELNHSVVDSQETRPALARALAAFGRARLLIFDRDASTREPTVDVAHEALLREWPRLRDWLQSGRGAVGLQRQLAQATAEWRAAQRDPGFLLVGARLSQVESWLADDSMALTPEERALVTASVAHREQLERAEAARRAQEARLERRARAVLQALVAVAVAAAMVAGGLAWWANDRRVAAQAAEQGARANLLASEAQRLAAESKALILEGHDISTAALLAIRSLKLTYTPQGDEALSLAMPQEYPIRSFGPHAGQLWSGGFLPGNERVFTVSSIYTGSVRTWDVTTGAVIRSFDVDRGCFEARLSPDGLNLAAACNDNQAHVWNLATGDEVLRVTHGAQDVNPRVLFSPDGRSLLTGGAYAPARMWDLESGDLIREFAPPDSPLPGGQSMAFTTDGTRLVIGGQDKVVRLWDVATGVIVREYRGHTDWVWGVAVSPDDRTIASTSMDSGGARLWDLATGRELRRFPSVGSTSYQLEFTKDGRGLIIGGADATARLWNVETGAEVRRFPHAQATLGVALSADDRYVLTVSWDGLARLWDLVDTRSLPQYDALGSPAYGALSADGALVALASNDNVIRVIEVASGKAITTLTGSTSPIWDLAFSPGDRTLAATSPLEPATRLWDIQTGRLVWTDPGYGGQSLLFAPDGGSALSIYANPRRYDATTGRVLQEYRYPETLLYGALSPDGSLLVTGLGNKSTLLFWDALSGELLRTLEDVDTGVFRALRFSPDGRYLAVGGDSGVVTLLEAKTGSVIRRFVGHTTFIERALAFSPDGRWLASGAFDRTVRIWDVATGQELRHIAGYADGLAVVAFTPDSARLLTIGYDGTARFVWVDLHNAVDDLCRRLLADLTDQARSRYGIQDQDPTCSANPP